MLNEIYAEYLNKPILLSVVMLNVVRLSAIMLNVVAPQNMARKDFI
jgi:hypothetical protein